jgi:hypothetical protein
MRIRYLASFILVVILTSVTFLAGAIQRSTSPAVVPDLNQNIYDQIHSMTSTFDQNRATSLAISSQEFQSKTQGLGATFNSIFNTWSYSLGPQGVSVSWKDVNVVYTIRNANKSYTNIVVTENPGLTRILDVSVQLNVGSLGTTNSANQPVLAAFPMPSLDQIMVDESSLKTTGSQPSVPQTMSGVPDFGISASTTSLSFVAGGSGSSVITLNSLNGFVGSIAVVDSMTPSSGTVPSIPLSANSITLMSGASGTSTLSVSSTQYVPAGVYTVTVKAVSGSLVHSVVITVTVQAQIQMTVTSPSPGSFTAGGSATSTVTLTSYGYSGTVSLTAPVSPSVGNGPATSLSPASISLGYGGMQSSTLTISTTTSTPSNTYTITVNADGGGGITASTQVTVIVQYDFQISAGSYFYLAPNGAASSTITLTSYGLTGNIGLSSNPPSGISTSFSTNPVSVSPGGTFTSSMSISVSSSMATGTYSFSVTGSYGSLSHSATVTVYVCDPSSNSGSLAGYTFREACGLNGQNAIDDARGTWTVPSVIEPQNGWCAFSHCDVTFYVSLSDTDGDTNGHLAAAGTDSGEYCSFGCAFYYYGIYQIDANAWVKCSTSINSGDSVTARAYQLGAPGPGGPYDLYVTDNTNGQVCSATNQSSAMQWPYYGGVLAQRPQISGSIARLPKFGTVTVSACDMYNVFYNQRCLDAYNTGFYTQYTMNNGGNNDITVNAVQSDNTFTFTWQTSAGT